MKRDVLGATYLGAFCAELSLLLRAGIPVNEGLGMLLADERDSGSRALLEQLYAHTDAGEPLCTAMEQQGCFPDYVVHMTRLGETTGRLEDVLAALSDYYTRREALADTIRSAVVYPAVLLVMMAAVILILLTRVLPIFSDVFAQLGTTMSPVAAALMRAGQAISASASVLVLAAVVLVAAALILRRIPAAKRRMSALWQRLTGRRGLGLEIAEARFAGAMALGLASGLETEQLLGLAGALCAAPAMDDRLAVCRAQLAQNAGFADALGASGIFSARDSRLLSVGFRTGTADEIMQTIARRSEQRAEAHITAVVGRIEPAVVILLSLVVGLILLAVMLPLVSILSAVG